METAKGKTREETINKLADRIDIYEKYVSSHSRLMAELASRLARRLGLTPQDTSAIEEAALLHDIGLYAMGPPYHSSPNPLSFEERMDLWRHPVVGEQQMAKREATRHAQLLVRWHHEWWNGTGYPDTLAFEDIPVGARVLRAVELYCALISDRPYRAALGAAEALESLKKSAGIECDPSVVEALVALINDLLTEPQRDEIRPAEPVSEPQPPPVHDEAPALPARDLEPAKEYNEQDSEQPAGQLFRTGTARDRGPGGRTGNRARGICRTAAGRTPRDGAPRAAAPAGRNIEGAPA